MIQKENFWCDQEKAQSTIKEKNILEKKLNSFLSLENEFDELNELTKVTNEDDEKLLILYMHIKLFRCWKVRF